MDHGCGCRSTWLSTREYAKSELTPRPRVAAGARVQRLPAPADGGGGRARERGAGLGGAQLAAGPLVAGQGDAGYGTGTVL